MGEIAGPDIVVVGSLNMDLVVKTQRIPVPGETVRGGDLRSIAGGKGANQAVAAAHLGASVGMVGRVGDDSFGDHLLEEMTRQGVMIDYVRRDNQAASGTALIVVDARGENCIVISPGANGRVSLSDVDQAEEWIGRAKVVLLQLEIPLEVVEHTIRLAARHGVMTILNPAPASEIPPEIYTGVGILVPNFTELASLTGSTLKGLDSVQEAAGQLLERGVQAVVVTLGEKGAYLVTKHESTLLPSFPVRVIDTTAAGDAFIGGLAVAWMTAGDLIQAVRFANACGALATTRFGAQPSLPNAEQVEAMLASG